MLQLSLLHTVSSLPWNQQSADAERRAMGAPAHRAPTIEDSRNVDIRYMLAAADAFTNSLAPPLKIQGKRFRFVLLGGMLACRDQNKALWFMQTTRKMKVGELGLALQILADILGVGRS